MTARIRRGRGGRRHRYGGGGDTISTGAGADKFYFYYNTNLSALGALARITDYQTGSDRLDISGYWGTAKTFVFNNGDRQLGALVASGPNQDDPGQWRRRSCRRALHHHCGRPDHLSDRRRQ